MTDINADDAHQQDEANELDDSQLENVAGGRSVWDPSTPWTDPQDDLRNDVYKEGPSDSSEWGP